MSAPAGLIRSTATTVFAGVIGAMSAPPDNPLVEGDQLQAARLAKASYLALPDAMDDPAPRRDLALAAFLQNRAEDDGRAMRSRGRLSSDYAVATALHLRYPEIGQGESTAVLHAATIRRAQGVDPADARRVAELLDVWQGGMTLGDAAEAIAVRLDQIYAAAGMPTRVGQLGIAHGDIPAIAAETVKNFNASAGMASADDRVAASVALLEAAW